MHQPVKRIGRAVALVCMVTLLTAGVATADVGFADGDGAVPVSSANNPLKIDGNAATAAFDPVCVGQTYNDTALIAIQRAGLYTDTARVFGNNASVTVTLGNLASPPVIENPNAPDLNETMTDSTIALPANWDSVPEGTMSSALAIPNPTAELSVTLVPSAAGGTSTVPLNTTLNLKATGANKDGGTINRQFTLKVEWYAVTSGATCDATAPDTSITAQPANPINSTSASFSFTGTDNVTPAASLTFECKLDAGAFAACTSPESYTGLAEGSHTFQVRAKDASNNVDATPASYTWLIDTTVPSIDCTVPNQTIWYGSNVSVPCTASDGGSGLADPTNDQSFSLGTTVAAGAETSSAATGTRTVFDNATNSSTAGPYTFMVDRKGPTVTCNTPAPSFALNASPANVGASVSDAGSGALSTTASAAADTSSVGSKTVDVTGYDNAGNSTTVSCSYSVGYNFTGFFSPVDNNNVLNKAKAGQAIPLKWRLTDANGDPVLDLSSVKLTVSSLTCSLSTTTDLVEEYATGSSGLQNLGDGYYQFNWSTPKSYANSCKTAKLDLGEGAGNEHTALFQFTK